MFMFSTEGVLQGQGIINLNFGVLWASACTLTLGDILSFLKVRGGFFCLGFEAHTCAVMPPLLRCCCGELPDGPEI